MPTSLAERPSRTPAPRLGFLSVLRALFGSGRRAWAHQARPTHPIGLGVGPLPDEMHQLPHGAAAALVARDARSAALWFPALLTDAVSASPVFLLAPSPEWADHLLTHTPLHDAHAQGQLVVWTMAPGLQPLLRTQGLQSLLHELQSAGLQPSHALYVMDAQQLFTGLDVLRLQRLGEQLRVWCLGRQPPVVLGFFPPPETDAAPDATASHPADVLPMLHGLCSMTLHIATLSTSAESSTLRLERWNSRSGAVFQTGLGLTLDPQTQQLHHNGSCTQGQNQTLMEAPDQRVVIATRAALAQQAGVPQHWQIVETLDEVAVATAQSMGATVLLDAGDSSEFEERARLVHYLRLTRPHTLKIVVRESTGKLRSHSEQALLQLGANAVFYRELGFSRLLQLLQDIQSQSYTRPVNPDYVQALDAFMPAPMRGYQPAPTFSRLVRDMLERTQDIGLGHSMVRLDIAPQIAHLTALRACRVSRDGDLVTASRSAVYVFLFACREPDIESALERLFDVPVAQLFTAQSADCSGAGMIALLEGLDNAARQGLPDYSSLLAPATPALPAAPVTAYAVATPQPFAVAMAPALAVATAESADLGLPATLPAGRPSVHARPIGQRHTAP